MSSGFGCKEVYRFPHITYPYSSCICSFCSNIPTFCSFLFIHVYTIYTQQNYIYTRKKQLKDILLYTRTKFRQVTNKKAIINN